MIDWPDCLRGWLIDIPADWLSVNIWQFGYTYICFSHKVTAIDIAVSSAA